MNFRRKLYSLILCVFTFFSSIHVAVAADKMTRKDTVKIGATAAGLGGISYILTPYIKAGFSRMPIYTGIVSSMLLLLVPPLAGAFVAGEAHNEAKKAKEEGSSNEVNQTKKVSLPEDKRATSVWVKSFHLNSLAMLLGSYLGWFKGYMFFKDYYTQQNSSPAQTSWTFGKGAIAAGALALTWLYLKNKNANEKSVVVHKNNPQKNDNANVNEQIVRRDQACSKAGLNDVD